jgi:hypothetical protein
MIMGDLRVRYGLAYGRMNNFYTGSTDQTKRGYLAGTDGLFLQANTAPDVTNGFLFYTNNSAATTINDFKLSTPHGSSGNVAGLFEGKVIRIFTLDSNTTISGSRIYSSSSDQALPQNSMIEFLYHNSAWYQYDFVSGKAISQTLNVAGTAVWVDANQSEKIVALQGTASPVILKAISGGYVGQTITFYGVGSGGIKYQANTDGNLVIANSNSFSWTTSGATASGGVMFVKINTTQWILANGGW